MEEMYLRFSSPTGWFVGEAVVKNNEKVSLVVNQSNYGKIGIIRDESDIIIPYWSDSRIQKGKRVLDLRLKDEDIEVFPYIDRILGYFSKPRTFFRKAKEEKNLLEKFTNHSLRIPKFGKETNGIIIPYNAFSFEETSFFKDPRISESLKDMCSR